MLLGMMGLATLSSAASSKPGAPARSRTSSGRWLETASDIVSAFRAAEEIRVYRHTRKPNPSGKALKLLVRLSERSHPTEIRLLKSKPYALELYRPHYEALPNAKRKDHETRDALFRDLFCRPLDAIRFLGLWDTVKSYGYLSPVSLPHTRHNHLVRTVRHALALDERRSFFAPTSWGGLDREDDLKVPDQDVQEVWFAGYHSDVGGGHEESESGLARYSLEWMLDEAEKAGLLLDAGGRNAVLPKPPADPATQDKWFKAHPSHTGVWSVSEHLPRWELVNVPLPPKRKFRMGPAGPRLPESLRRNGEVLVHASVPVYASRTGRDYPLPQKTRYVGTAEPALAEHRGRTRIDAGTPVPESGRPHGSG